SSRNKVPLSTSSKRPTPRSVAPVNAPRSCPNISDSTRSFGMAALFTHTNRFAARPLWRWIAEATSSLPVPDSPVISTRASVGATRAIRARTSSMAGLTPTSGSAWPSASCRRRFSASVRDSLTAARRLRHPDRAVVGLDRLPHQREAQPGPVLLGREVGLEHPLPLLLRNARPMVGDGHEHALAVLRHTDLDRPVASHRLSGVAEQVRERAPQRVVLAEQRARSAIGADRHGDRRWHGALRQVHQ